MFFFLIVIRIRKHFSVTLKMADDQAWVFDSLVCFLHGPIWNAPIQNFIEEKSISE